MSDRDAFIIDDFMSTGENSGQVDSSPLSPVEQEVLCNQDVRLSEEGNHRSLPLARQDELDLIRRIVDLSPENIHAQARLQTLTAQLIRIKKRRGSLLHDPSITVRRRLPVSSSIVDKIRDRTILVTGGAGCIGRALVQRLIQYGPRRVVLVSRSPVVDERSVHHVVRGVHVDIRDRDSLVAVFARYRPDVVYHLAAQRLPSLGETQIADTISTNVFGTRNIVDLSREFGAGQCLVVSTAKAVNYFPSQVYNQTKKLEEWAVLADSAGNGPAYGVIRLTHVVDNSWLLHKMREGMKKGLVALQAPDVSFYAQQVEEANDLLLNALSLVEVGRATVFSSEDLGWPINLLDLALYKISELGSVAGIYFMGAQPGYEDHIFRGVLNLTAPTRCLPHALHNALERRIEDPRTTAAGVRASCGPPCDSGVLATVLDQLQRELGGMPINSFQLRSSLQRAVAHLVLHMFLGASPEHLLNIARWGASPSVLRMTGTLVVHHRDTLIPLMQSLLPRLSLERLLQSDWHLPEWEAFLDDVGELPELKAVVTEWRALAGNRSISMRVIS